MEDKDLFDAAVIEEWLTVSEKDKIFATWLVADKTGIFLFSGLPDRIVDNTWKRRTLTANKIGISKEVCEQLVGKILTWEDDPILLCSAEDINIWVH